MGWTTDLLTGLAEHLAAAGVGVWRPTGTYLAGETAIVIRAIPQQPDRLITLAPYPIGTPTKGMQDHLSAVQIRLRGTSDPRVVEDLADEAFDLLDSSGRLTLGGIAVVDMWRQSYTSLGADANGRWEASHNYYLEAMRATARRTD